MHNFYPSSLLLAQYAICILIFSVSSLCAQNENLNVEGDVKIRGHLNISMTDADTSFISIGHLSGGSPSNMNSISATGLTNRIRVAPTLRDNTFVGAWAGQNNTGYANSIFGSRSGQLGDGSFNAFFGYLSGNANEGVQNSFFGSRSGLKNLAGLYNTYIGDQSGVNGINGSRNAYIGTLSGAGNRNGSRSVLVGYWTARGDTSIDNSVYIGSEAGGSLNTTARTGNVFIGHKTGFAWTEHKNNTLIIDNSETQKPLILGDFSANSLNIHGDLNVKTSQGDDILVIDQEQRKVGIGTSTPVEGKMQIEGGLNNHLALTRSNVGTIHMTATDPLGLSITDGGVTTYMHVRATTSRVGIGTSNPLEELHVLGDGLFTGRLEADLIQSSEIIRLTPYDDTSTTPACNSSNDLGSLYFSLKENTIRVCGKSGLKYDWFNL